MPINHASHPEPAHSAPENLRLREWNHFDSFLAPHTKAKSRWTDTKEEKQFCLLTKIISSSNIKDYGTLKFPSEDLGVTFLPSTALIRAKRQWTIPLHHISEATWNANTGTTTTERKTMQKSRSCLDELTLWRLRPTRKQSTRFTSVQFSHVQLFVTPWTTAHQVSLSITNFWSSFKLMSIESVMPSNHLILCHPLLLTSIFSGIRIFSKESALRSRWPKYWTFSISPFNEYSGLISFRIDWSDLLIVQGTLKSLLQHHSSKASILWCSGFFTVQLSHPYMTTGKNIALTRQTFGGKVMSLLFNMLSRLVMDIASLSSWI